MCTYTYIYIHIYTYIHICIHIYTYVCIYKYVDRKRLRLVRLLYAWKLIMRVDYCFRALLIWISNWSRNTDHTLCTVTTFRNFGFVTSFTPWGKKNLQYIFFSKQIWSHFGHKCHTWSQIQMWLVTNLFLFLFSRKWFGMNEAKYTRNWALFLFPVWNQDQNVVNNATNEGSI